MFLQIIKYQTWVDKQKWSGGWESVTQITDYILFLRPKERAVVMFLVRNMDCEIESMKSIYHSFRRLLELGDRLE